MKRSSIVLAFLGILLCTSCYSYKLYPKKYRHYTNQRVRQNAYVRNDSLKKALKILEASELFTIVTDSSSADLHITLYPLEQNVACATPMLPTMLTLGQMPVVVPEKYYFRFDETVNDSTVKRNFSLNISRRVWFWDLFTFSKRFNKKAGKAVLGAYRSSSATP